MDLPIGSLAYFDGKNLVKGVHYTYKNKLDFATKQKQIIFINSWQIQKMLSRLG